MPNMMRGRFVPHHGGPVGGALPGRADHARLSVPSGSFILPSDTVSALGESNSAAGFAVLQGMFPQSQRMANGGEVVDDDQGEEQVPVRLSSGEYVLDPETVAQVGGGDIGKGHKILNRFVLQVRREYVKRLRSLPRPKI